MGMTTKAILSELGSELFFSPHCRVPSCCQRLSLKQKVAGSVSAGVENSHY